MIESITSDFRKIEVNQIIDEGYSYAIEKLITSYVEKGKLEKRTTKNGAMWKYKSTR